MVQSRSLDSLTADGLHKGLKQLKSLSNSIISIKTTDKLENLYIEFVKYQNSLVNANNKTALSAKTSIQHAGYFINYYKLSKINFDPIDLSNEEFKKLVEDYWSNECSRKKISKTKFSAAKPLANSLSKNGIDKSKQQLQLFLKFVKFRSQLGTSKMPISKFDYIKISLPDEYKLTFDNPLNTKNKIVGSSKSISLTELKRFIDFLNTKNTNDILLATILVMISENGYRWAELLTVKLKNIINHDGMHILEMEHSKTFLRGTILIYSWPYLKKWMEHHPDPNNEEAYLFANKLNTNPVEYATLLKLFRIRLDEYNKANPTIKINFPNGHKFHLLRHFAATRFANWPVALRDFYLGWVTEGQFGKTYFEPSYEDNIKKCKKLLDETYIAENNPFIAAPPTNKIKQLDKNENDEKIKALQKALEGVAAEDLIKVLNGVKK